MPTNFLVTGVDQDGNPASMVVPIYAMEDQPPLVDILVDVDEMPVEMADGQPMFHVVAWTNETTRYHAARRHECPKCEAWRAVMREE